MYCKIQFKLCHPLAMTVAGVNRNILKFDCVGKIEQRSRCLSIALRYWNSHFYHILFVICPKLNLNKKSGIKKGIPHFCLGPYLYCSSCFTCHSLIYSSNSIILYRFYVLWLNVVNEVHYYDDLLNNIWIKYTNSHFCSVCTYFWICQKYPTGFVQIPRKEIP